MRKAEKKHDVTNLIFKSRDVPTKRLHMQTGTGALGIGESEKGKLLQRSWQSFRKSHTMSSAKRKRLEATASEIQLNGVHENGYSCRNEVEANDRDTNNGLSKQEIIRLRNKYIG